ncbi:tetratricopeptide repeat protein, partial [Rhodospirillaceae bacterium]|nr:tetratricopeptide repeat protein [Rhodospirillaceae bacterium]
KEVLEEGRKNRLPIERLDKLNKRMIAAYKAQSPPQQQLDELITHYQNGQHRLAEELALSITERFPHCQFAWKVLGALLGQAERINEALIANEKAVKINSKDAEAQNNLGNTLKELNRLEEAKDGYKQAIKLKPDFVQAHYNLGITLRALNKLELCEISYRKAIALRPDYAEAYYNLGIALQELGKLEISKSSFKKAITLKISYAEAYNNLGNVLKEMGKLEDAKISYKQAIRLLSDYTEAHYNLGNVLQKLGQFEESGSYYKQSIILKPDHATAHNNFGNMLKEMGKLEDAKISYQRVIELKPNYPTAYYNLGNILQKLGELKESEGHYRRAIILKPNYTETYSNLGVTLQKLGRLDETIDIYEYAIRLGGSESFRFYNNLANTFTSLQKLQEAELNYRCSLVLKPCFPDAYYNFGRAQQVIGKPEVSRDSYRRGLIVKPDFAKAHNNLTLIKKFDVKDEHYIQMEKLYADQTLCEENRCYLNFALGKASEDLYQIEKSFYYYSKGNALRKKLLNYDIRQDIQLFEQLRSNRVNLRKAAIDILKSPSDLTPIFIIGMPRSGTTLVEQIISSHPKVSGAGELPYVEQFGGSIARGTLKTDNRAIIDFRTKYHQKLQNHSNGNSIVTDKMPHNFLYLGLIFSALPEAKIIHVTRNSGAVCWGNFKQIFLSKALGYCYALHDIVTYYSMYLELMQFWETEHDKNIFEINYEELTIDQENVTKNLIKHLDLEWDEKCLAPQENKRWVTTASQIQVRKAIYKGSSEDWRKFEPFLGHAFDKLNP